MTNGPLRDVRIKIDRAKKHLADLNSTVLAFESRNPFQVVMQVDPNTGYELYHFRQKEPIPDEWGAIVGDIVHSLRSALDYLACALVINGGGTPGDYTSFPIGSDATHFRTSAITRINGASSTAIMIVGQLQPYAGGNERLYQLHRLSIVDKHRLLIPVAAAHKTIGFLFDQKSPGTDHYPPARWISGPPLERKFPLKDGDQIFSYNRPPPGPDLQDNSDFKFVFEVAFGEGQIFDGEAQIPTLTELVNFSEGIIDIFAKRIFGLASW